MPPPVCAMAVGASRARTTAVSGRRAGRTAAQSWQSGRAGALSPGVRAACGRGRPVRLASASMSRVFVTCPVPGGALDRLRAVHEVEVFAEHRPPTRDELFAGVAAADGLLALLVDTIDAELLDQAPKLRAIANYAV